MLVSNMGEARIRCHCGISTVVHTSYNGEHGWYECDCGCAWSYEDIGRGVVILSKQRDCEELTRAKTSTTILRHYPSGEILEGKY